MPADRRSELTVWGLRSCDTCRKARAWLEEEGVPFTFHDVRDDGVPAAELRTWAASPAAADLLNRRSTTWRGLDHDQRQRAGADLTGLLGDHPTLIKRPVIVRDGRVLAVGFTPAARERLRAR